MNLGQIYTKRKVADYMVGLFSSKVKKILDPCFGGGVFVDSIIENTLNDVVAVEIDNNSFKSYKNPDVSRCQLFNDSFFQLFDDSFFNIMTRDFDGIIMNPPYVRQEEIDDMKPLGVSKAVLRKACAPLSIPSKSNLYVYFVLRAAQLLPNHGELVAIFPNTWKLTPDGRKFESLLCKMGSIEKYINVDGNPFEGAPLVEVCIIKFVKGSNESTQYYNLKVNDMYLKEYCETVSSSYNQSDMPLLSSIANIRRGITTGANKVFINPPLMDRTHVLPILSSPKNVKGYSTTRCTQDEFLAINIGDTLSEEEDIYLSNSASLILKMGKPITLKKLIDEKRIWYNIKRPVAPLLIFSYIIRDNIKFVYNEKKCIVRDNFYSIYSNVSPYILMALLNNYYTYIQLEKVGKKYGNGVLKIQTYDLNNIHIPALASIEKNDLEKLEHLSVKLVKTSGIDCVNEITEVLEKYYPVSNPKHEYNELKTRRLQKV